MIDADVHPLKPRPLLRSSLVLLAVLAAVVAAAWAVVAVRAGATRRGIEIVRRLQEQGLPQLLGSQPQVRAYRVTEPQSARGWRLIRVEPAPKGYAGLAAEKLQDGKRAYQAEERWRATDNLSRVEYEATDDMATRRGVSILLTAQSVTNRTVTVIMAQGSEGISGKGPAPDNYVPEGMLPLAIRLAAEGGEPANITMILNNEALRPTARGVYEPNFTPAQIRPRSGGQVEIKIAGSTQTYTLNDSGQIIHIRHDSGLEYSAVPVEELRKNFDISQFLR
ncbi:MAG: hypothetical protein ABFD92_19655 [Planctomycetaceae bacterium]|nr:hypothetical protein [Planctomycetaceae bacterium]